MSEPHSRLAAVFPGPQQQQSTRSLAAGAAGGGGNKAHFYTF